MTPEALERCGDDPFLGRVVADRYVVFDLLGEGGFSAVYRAIQEPLGREIALKTIRLGRGSERETRKRRFFQEAKILAKLTHPGIVRVFDYGEDEGGLYMALELIHGQPLSERLKAGPLSPTQAIELCVQILDALVEPHEHQLVHRDLKPDNILLVKGRTGLRVKIIDFGIAKALIKEGEQPNTRTGLTIGTVNYMAPEQLKAKGRIGPWSDQYAVGVILFQMLSGRIPFTGSEAEVASGHLKTPPPPLPSHLNVPMRLEQIMARALSKEHEARFEHVNHMLDALMHVAGTLHQGRAAPEAPKLRAPSFEPAAPDTEVMTPQRLPSAPPIPEVEGRDTLTVMPPKHAREKQRIQGRLLILIALAAAILAGGGAAALLSASEEEPPPEGPVVVVKPIGEAPQPQVSPPLTAPQIAPPRAPRGRARVSEATEERAAPAPPSPTVLLKEAERHWRAKRHGEALEAYVEVQSRIDARHPEWRAVEDRVSILKEEVRFERLVRQAKHDWKRGRPKAALRGFTQARSMISPNHPQWGAIKDRIAMLREELR